jgi:AcrR family transcriptional regulator
MVASRPPKIAAQEPAAPKRRQRRTPEAARELILQTAQRLIAERGPDRIGLKEIAQAAGISHALINHYFGSYEALVEETIRAQVRRFRESLLTRIAATREVSPAEWLRATLELYSQPGAGRLMLWAMMTGRLSGPDAFPRKDQGLRQTADVLEERLRALVGKLPIERSELEMLLVIALTSIWGYALSREIIWPALGHKQSRELDEKYQDSLSALLLRALTP